MASQLIPTDSGGRAYYSQRTTLDGKEYLLSFAFNQREMGPGRWYLSIADAAGNEIVNGIKLVCNSALLYAYHWNPLVPPGDMVVVDTSGDGSPPGFTELGEGLRCQLLYNPVT